MSDLSTQSNRQPGLRTPDPTTDLDKIIDYMTDSSESISLSEPLRKRMDRIEYAYDHIRQRYQDKDIVTLIVKKFNVSSRTAYNDIYGARYIHGKVGAPNLDFEIKELLQLSLQSIKMAIHSGKVKLLIEAIRERTNILKLIKEKSDDPLLKAKPSSYFMVLKFPDGDAISLDMEKVATLDAETVTVLESRLQENFDRETLEILVDVPGTGTAGTAAESEPDAGQQPAS